MKLFFHLQIFKLLESGERVVVDVADLIALHVAAKEGISFSFFSTFASLHVTHSSCSFDRPMKASYGIEVILL